MPESEAEARALERAIAERVRIVKLAGEQRYLARSRKVEPGAYYELTVSPWGQIHCSCPGFLYRSACKHTAALKRRLAAEKDSTEHNPLSKCLIFERNDGRLD